MITGCTFFVFNHSVDPLKGYLWLYLNICSSPDIFMQITLGLTDKTVESAE